MLYYLSQQLINWSAGTVWAERLSPLRLFRYITFRSAGAALTALLLSWALGPRVIAWLKRLKFGQEYVDKAEAGGGLQVMVMGLVRRMTAESAQRAALGKPPIGHSLTDHGKLLTDRSPLATGH